MCEDWTRHPLPEEKHEEYLEKNHLFECEECGKAVDLERMSWRDYVCQECYEDLPEEERG
ncbi:MAG: hypothetical protein R3Y56_08435 [Akkermansia sp.]